MTRKPLFLLLILISSLALSACGTAAPESSPDNTASGATTSKPATARQTTTQTPETSVEENTAASIEETTPKKKEPGENAKANVKSNENSSKARGKEKGRGREVVTVKIKGLKYIPRQVTISPGATVVWVNEDSADHSVTSDESSGPLQSKTFGQSGTFEHKFQEPGIFDYFCTVHPFMTGSVKVR